MSQTVLETIDSAADSTNVIPMLLDWTPNPEDLYMEFKGEFVQAHYEKLGLAGDNKLSVYVIKKDHYKKRMDDICNVINYYLTFYDTDLELFHAMMSVKFVIDQKPNMETKAFRKFLIEQVVTKGFISRIKEMTRHLYTINIDSDVEGKYKSTPKISNDQARLITALSFAIRCVLPVCVHYSDTNIHLMNKNKQDYIPCFDKIIVKIIRLFEKDDIPVLNTIENFVRYRVERSWKADFGMCFKKKQLYGTTMELYLEEVIHEIVLVKSLYKLEYNRSVVSFIDGVIFNYHGNFKIEKFKFKPIEIDQQETMDDDSERLSHAEAIEMASYRIDESIALINDVNTKKVLEQIKHKFNIPVSDEELEFYYNRMVINPVTKLFVSTFYNRFFHDPDATLNLSRETIILLIVLMKKYLQYSGMVLIPQLCTAKVRGKYKENSIKNSKFIEKRKTSDIWNSIIDKKFSYVSQINPKEDIINKRFSTFVNLQFEFVDYEGPDDGMIYEDIDQDLIIYEFSLFLSII